MKLIEDSDIDDVTLVIFNKEKTKKTYQKRRKKMMSMNLPT